MNLNTKNEIHFSADSGLSLSQQANFKYATSARAGQNGEKVSKILNRQAEAFQTANRQILALVGDDIVLKHTNFQGQNNPLFQLAQSKSLNDLPKINELNRENWDSLKKEIKIDPEKTKSILSKYVEEINSINKEITGSIKNKHFDPTSLTSEEFSMLLLLFNPHIEYEAPKKLNIYQAPFWGYYNLCSFGYNGNVHLDQMTFSEDFGPNITNDINFSATYIDSPFLGGIIVGTSATGEAWYGTIESGKIVQHIVQFTGQIRIWVIFERHYSRQYIHGHNGASFLDPIDECLLGYAISSNMFIKVMDASHNELERIEKSGYDVVEGSSSSDINMPIFVEGDPFGGGQLLSLAFTPTQHFNAGDRLYLNIGIESTNAGNAFRFDNIWSQLHDDWNIKFVMVWAV